MAGPGLEKRKDHNDNGDGNDDNYGDHGGNYGDESECGVYPINQS